MYHIFKNILLKISKHSVFLIEFIVSLLGSKKYESKVIFICGVPRSGSTILYQELTNTLRFAYTDNYTHYVTNQSFVGGNIASEYFLRNNPHNCFSSNYGSTTEYGLNAPNEAGKYWKKVRDSKNLSFLKRDFDLIYKWTKKPYIVKNLYNSLLIDELHDTLPNVKFVHIKRDRTNNIKSLIAARKKHGVLCNEDWSVMPKYSSSFQSQEERVNFQYDEINRIISNKLVNKKKIVIDYDTFISNKEAQIEKLLKFCCD